MRNVYDFSKGIRGKYVGNVTHRIVRTRRQEVWRNPSVRLLAGDANPVDVVREKARAIILDALDSQSLSLPVDPFKLAELRSVQVIPRRDVREAQIVPGPNNALVIEYNPDRSRARIRFSICHELAHTLFPDCAQQVRHRGFHTHYSATAQELETLCNLAAAEFLLPLGSIQDDIRNLNLSIDAALDLRKKYEASVEAVLLRLVGLSAAEFAVFAAVAEQTGEQRYRLEYVKSSSGWEAAQGKRRMRPWYEARRLSPTWHGCTRVHGNRSHRESGRGVAT